MDIDVPFNIHLSRIKRPIEPFSLEVQSCHRVKNISSIHLAWLSICSRGIKEGVQHFRGPLVHSERNSIHDGRLAIFICVIGNFNRRSSASSILLHF